MEDITCWSLSDDTNVIASPLVPNRPARLLAHKHQGNVKKKTHVPNAVQVAIRIRRAIIINDDINSFNIDATAKDVSGNKDALLECFEGGITADSKVKGWLTSVKPFDNHIRTVLLVEVPSEY